MIIRPLAAGALVLVLAGCAPAAETPAPVPTTTATQTILAPELAPQSVSLVSADFAASEATRLADAIQNIIDPAIIVDVGEQAELVPADDDIAAYYGLLRAVTIDPANDPLTLAETMTAILGQSGWTVSQTSNDSGIYLATLVGGPAEAPWVLFIEGKATVEGEASVSITLGSPGIAA